MRCCGCYIIPSPFGSRIMWNNRSWATTINLLIEMGLVSTNCERYEANFAHLSKAFGRGNNKAVLNGRPKASPAEAQRFSSTAQDCSYLRLGLRTEVHGVYTCQVSYSTYAFDSALIVVLRPRPSTFPSYCECTSSLSSPKEREGS